MSTRTVRRISLHLLAIGTLASLAACSNNPTPLDPTSSGHIAAPSRASHDDGPPDLPCKSGWEDVSGKWVCNDPG